MGILLFLVFQNWSLSSRCSLESHTQDTSFLRLLPLPQGIQSVYFKPCQRSMLKSNTPTPLSHEVILLILLQGLWALLSLHPSLVSSTVNLTSYLLIKKQTVSIFICSLLKQIHLLYIYIYKIAIYNHMFCSWKLTSNILFTIK